MFVMGRSVLQGALITQQDSAQTDIQQYLLSIVTVLAETVFILRLLELTVLKTADSY